jgi:two-component system, sensor histidine kinase and response regulator
LRVLVVDDNASAREILSTMARTYGLEVDVASSAREALKSIEEATRNKLPYDLTLMDWKMPGMDGVECVKAFQGLEGVSPPAVIMVTAYGREEAMGEASSQGAEIKAVLTKPVTPSTLLDAIGETLGGGLIRREEGGGDKTKQADEALAKLRGAKLLLVEDNEINQELALELLAKGGITVHVANNGQEAVDKVESEPYDGVLMDIQMPVMDGYQATSQIRNQDRFRDLPIIAMTANAMSGDRDKVLQAGMNDHIAKPINVREMFATMAKWITPSGLVSEPVVFAGADISEEEPIPDLPGIDTKAGLTTTDGNNKLYRRLLNRFKTGQANFVTSFKEILEEGDMPTAERQAHTLKGVAGNLGAKGVQQSAFELEEGCENRVEREQIEELLEQVDRDLSVVLTGLESLSEQSKIITPRSSHGTVNKEIISPIIEKLRGFLEEDEIDSLQVIEELAEILKETNTIKLVDKLSEQVNGYDFETALSTLDELKDQLN